MQIGPYRIDPPLILAPMAGVTDRPFRTLCRRLGAGMVVSEMVAADPRLRHTAKNRRRLQHDGESAPIAVQIAGYDPQMMADAARWNVDQGAQIIDINMGCPAKKVCRRDAGSALLRDEALVARILDAVVRAVDVPVTLKTRTGWSPERRNGPRVARIAEGCGIAAIAIHGRTRADRFAGQAEYETIAQIKASVRIPVIANGDITDAAKAAAVLRATGADALMIGRAAQGNPWIFRQIAGELAAGRPVPPPSAAQVRRVLSEHLQGLYALYGERAGVRIARKHIGWYCDGRPGGRAFRRLIMGIEDARAQHELVCAFISGELSLEQEQAA